MSMFSLTPAYLVAFFLVFVRIGALCFTMPIFSSPRVPLYLRAGICLLLTFVILPVIAPHGFTPLPSMGLFALAIIREALVGLIIGFYASLIFNIVQMAGEMQDMQAGFGFAGVVDPSMSQQSAILGQFQMVCMWLIFLAVNGHQVMLEQIANSFVAVPLGMGAPNVGLVDHLFHLTTTLILIALQVGAPIIGAVLLTDLAMGIMQRTAPQLNFLAVGFQVKIAAALGITFLALPAVLTMMRHLVPYMERVVYDLMGAH